MSFMKDREYFVYANGYKSNTETVNVGVPQPPSLKNIFKALKNDYNDFVIPSHGYLYGWARQGVLMLNAVLTVEHSKANSHRDKGWEKLTPICMYTHASPCPPSPLARRVPQ